MCKAKSEILAMGVTPEKWPTCTVCADQSPVWCGLYQELDMRQYFLREQEKPVTPGPGMCCGWDCNGDGFVVLGKLAGLLWASHTWSYMWPVRDSA